MSALLLSTGIRWGIPSVDRARLYYDDPVEMARGNPHSVALASYHPDEPQIFMALHNMRPRELDFNPRYFLYPTLYIYAAGAALQAAALTGQVTLVPAKAFYFEHPAELGRFYVVARGTTVAFGILTVLACFWLGRRVYGERAGLLGALLLTVMPLFVVHSHFVTTDVPVTFWITASLLCVHLALTTRAAGWHAATGLTAGLAAATKYYGGVVILSLIISSWALTRGGAGGERVSRVSRPVWLGGLLVPVGFLLGCPYAVLAPRDFLEGLYLILDAQVIGGESYERVFGHFAWPFLYHLYLSLPQGMGHPLFVIALAAVGWALWRRQPGDVVLLAFVLPYYLLIGVSFLRPMRYAIPLLPPLALMSARLMLDAAAGLRGVRHSRLLRAGWAALLVGAVGYSLLASVAYDRLLARREVRDEAAIWLREHARPGSTIGLIFPPSFRTPPMDARRFELRTIGSDRAAFVRELPEYFVMTELEYRDFLRAGRRFPLEAAFLRELLSGRFSVEGYRYRLVAFRQPPQLLGWSFRAALPPHDWLYVSPDVMVFRREAGS